MEKTAYQDIHETNKEKTGKRKGKTVSENVKKNHRKDSDDIVK